MSDGPNLPQPPSDDEISERLKRAVERAAERVGPEEDHDPFASLQKEMADIPLGNFSQDDTPAGPKLPEHDPEFSARMNQLNDRVDSFRSKKDNDVERQGKVWKSEQEASRGLGFGLSIAYTIIGMPVVLALIGWAIDNHYHTTVWRGALAFFGMIIGVFYAVTVLNRTNRSE